MYILTFLFKEETNVQFTFEAYKAIKVEFFSSQNMVASNNGINIIVIIVINNRNFKGIIDNYDFCHNHAALILCMCIYLYT